MKGFQMAATLGQPRELLQRSQSMVNQAVDRGTSMLADRLEHYVNLAREVGDVLRERDEPQAADMLQLAAQRGSEVTRYLRNNDGAQIWSDAQLFARDKTWLLAGVGLLGGLAAARTIRTAVDHGSRDYVDGYAQRTTREYSS